MLFLPAACCRLFSNGGLKDTQRGSRRQLQNIVFCFFHHFSTAPIRRQRPKSWSYNVLSNHVRGLLVAWMDTRRRHSPPIRPRPSGGVPRSRGGWCSQQDPRRTDRPRKWMSRPPSMRASRGKPSSDGGSQACLPTCTSPSPGGPGGWRSAGRWPGYGVPGSRVVATWLGADPKGLEPSCKMGVWIGAATRGAEGTTPWVPSPGATRGRATTPDCSSSRRVLAVCAPRSRRALPRRALYTQHRAALGGWVCCPLDSHIVKNSCQFIPFSGQGHGSNGICRNSRGQVPTVDA